MHPLTTYSVTARNVDTGEFVEIKTNSAKVNQLVEKMKRSREFSDVRASEVMKNPRERARPYTITRYENGHHYKQDSARSLEGAKRGAEFASINQGGEYHVMYEGKSLVAFVGGSVIENPLYSGVMLGLGALGLAGVAGLIYAVTRPQAPGLPATKSSNVSFAPGTIPQNILHGYRYQLAFTYVGSDPTAALTQGSWTFIQNLTPAVSPGESANANGSYTASAIWNGPAISDGTAPPAAGVIWTGIT